MTEDNAGSSLASSFLVTRCISVMVAKFRLAGMLYVLWTFKFKPDHDSRNRYTAKTVSHVDEEVRIGTLSGGAEGTHWNGMIAHRPPTTGFHNHTWDIVDRFLEGRTASVERHLHETRAGSTRRAGNSRLQVTRNTQEDPPQKRSDTWTAEFSVG